MKGFRIPSLWFPAFTNFFGILFSLISDYRLLRKRGLKPSHSIKAAISILLTSCALFIMIIGSDSIPFGARSSDVNRFHSLPTLSHGNLELSLSAGGISPKISPFLLAGMVEYHSWAPFLHLIECRNVPAGLLFIAKLKRMRHIEDYPDHQVSSMEPFSSNKMIFAPTPIKKSEKTKETTAWIHLFLSIAP